MSKQASAMEYVFSKAAWAALLKVYSIACVVSNDNDTSDIYDRYDTILVMP